MADYICEYTYAPKSDKFKSCLLVSGCAAGAFGMLAVSEGGWILAPYFKAGAAVWLLLGMLFAARFLATGYVYSIFRDVYSGKSDLVISELRFGRSKTVCRVSLFDIKELRIYDPAAQAESARLEGKKRPKRCKRPRPDRKKHGGVRAYNYCVDVLPVRYSLLLVSGNETAYLRFSPDRVISDIISGTFTDK